MRPSLSSLLAKIKCTNEINFSMNWETFQLSLFLEQFNCSGLYLFSETLKDCNNSTGWAGCMRRLTLFNFLIGY